MKIRIFATGDDRVFRAGVTDLDVGNRVGVLALALAISYMRHGTVAFVFDVAPLAPRRVISVTEAGEARSLLTVGDDGDYRVDVFVEDDHVAMSRVDGSLDSAMSHAHNAVFDYT